MKKLPISAIALLVFASQSASASDDENFFTDWRKNVAKVQDSQPHWESLLSMSSPRLTEGFHYNYSRQYQSDSAVTKNYGGGKGLELILGKDLELQVGVPAYIQKDTPKKSAAGYADESFLARYRLASGNEEHGNYIVSGSLGVSVPTGNNGFSSVSNVITPTIAGGKGWGTRAHGFNVQTALSTSIPDHNSSGLGIPISWSGALQGHVLKEFWPEIEASFTHWNGGQYSGKNILVLTYGMVIGRIQLGGRQSFTFGIGYQDPWSNGTYNRGWISMAKLSF